MATITVRERADGTKSYRAAIRIKEKGKIIHAEAKTFDQRRLAEVWAKRREVELQAPGAIARAQGGPTVGELVKWYLRDYEATFGRTKKSSLNQFHSFALANERALSLTAADLIEHVKERRRAGTGPATVLNDLVWLRVLFKAARPALGIDLDLQIIADAFTFCRAGKLVSRPKDRDRRPTAAELQALDGYFTRPGRRSKVPMADLMWFALHSSRREGEIVRLRWDDNHEDDCTGLVRDAKHPTQKKGNHRTFKYTPEAWAIMERQPKTGEFIFPYKGKTIGDYFSDACALLEIDDLVFHDLRHEGTSRLFEAGYSIVEVQQFTLHESWNTLKRYTHLRPKDVKHR